MIPYLKPALIAVTVAGIASGSWMARGWYEGNQDLAILKAQNALAAEIRKGQADISKQVEDRLGELRANERVIDRGVIREIQKPIYKRVCFEPELVRLLNDAQRGTSTESDGEVSRDSTATD